MTIRTLSAIFLAITAANCQDAPHPLRFTVKVVDDKGDPVPNAHVGTSTFSHFEPGEGFGKDIWQGPERQLTDKEGKVVFEYPSKTGEVGISVSQKPEFYASSWPNYKFKEVIDGRWNPENPTIDYVLKRKRNPIPLYAKSLKEGLLVPILGEKCGYDFQAGDWVAPHGKGQKVDIFFKVTSKERDGEDFHSSVEITFPNEKDGLIFFSQNPYQGSELTSDHNAPAEGYKPSKLMRRFRENGQITNEMDTANGNYYLRLRTRVDKSGKIESANYAKVYGDFMYFIYYFNPNPNDLNLEFDPKRNLFKGENVTRP